MKSGASPELIAQGKAAFAGLFEDDAKHALDDLVARALAYRTGAELKALFDFIEKFPYIAPYNAMLLHVQNPGIQYVLRPKVWQQKYRRRIRPGARPYVILQTMGPVSFVFDLSDTEPIDPNVNLIPDAVANPFPTKGQPPLGALQQLIRMCAKVGVEIEQRDAGTQLAGSIQQTPGRTSEFYVFLNSKHTEAQQLGTLAHELGHLFCGHLGVTENGFWQDRHNESRAAREFEAEAVAYLITRRYKLDIGSVEYLSRYLSTDTRPNGSLEAVFKAVGRIEEMIGGRFRIKKKK